MKLIALLVLCLLLTLPAFSQSPSLQVEKAVGSQMTVSWIFPVASEANIDSFVVEACTGNNTGCTDLVTKLKTDRAHAFTVTATIKPFYQVRTIKGVGRSTASNPVAVTITIPPPLSAYGL